MKLILAFLILLVVVHNSYQLIIVLVKMCKNPILPAENDGLAIKPTGKCDLNVTGLWH